MNRTVPVRTPNRERRRIRLRGLVQGVGFRPHVYRCARHLGVTGFVGNDPEGVIIEAQGEQLDTFVQLLRGQLPPLARIDKLIQAPIALADDDDFVIAPTTPGAAKGAAIPADVAICDDCLRELFDSGNRRYLHPFIACCNCGPRYTMTRQLPYDRSNTAMAEFALCRACNLEYSDPMDRRFHAEPVACPDCGPRLSGDIGDTARALAAGDIVAIKGVGGYHLACDARNQDSVARLRNCKRRDGRPFAVMVLNLASAAGHVALTGDTGAHLQSRERPVVISPSLAGRDALADYLSPGLRTLGVMLPYTPVHYLLFHALLGAPRGHDWLYEENDLALVMTSANISGEPLITDAVEAERQLTDIVDRFLHHDRDIPARADDSVLRSAPGVTGIVRRARGFTPHAIKLAHAGPAVLALGPHLKSTVTMTRGNRAYLSPHVGDLDSAAAVAFHRESANAMRAMLQTRPQLIACDLARDFASTRLAEQLSAELALPLVTVQHHHAHVAAVLAEHRREEPTLGMALDGHGLGLDGTSWGGELLRVEGACLQRVGHLSPLPLPGGDCAAREPWRMAAAALHSLGRAPEITERFADEPLAPLLAQLLAAGECDTTSAAGRLFDAAAGLLGITHRATFEGEPPMLLEGLLGQDTQANGAYEVRDGILDFSALLARLANCSDPAQGAAEFHATLVEGLADWALASAGRTGIGVIALSGGCFLNAYLARELPPRLAAGGLEVLMPRALPPNDGAISLGQAWVAQRSQ